MKINALQVSVIVKDLDQSMQSYTSLFGIGPFCVYAVDTNEVAGVTHRGRPSDYGVRVGLAKLGSGFIELIEPRRGRSLFQEFLQKHGEGVHHIGFVVDDYAEAVRKFTEHGFALSLDGPIVNQKGKRDGRFTFFDTDQRTGTTLEVLDVPDNILASWGT